MNPDKIITRNNKVAGSLFAVAKFFGIIAVCMFYTKHFTVSGCLLCWDAMLLIACVAVCIKNMNLANSLENDNDAHPC
jgi:hypothetical protein